MLDSVFRLATQHKLWAHRRSSFQGWYLRSSLFRQFWGKNQLWFETAYVPTKPNQCFICLNWEVTNTMKSKMTSDFETYNARKATVLVIKWLLNFLVTLIKSGVAISFNQSVQDQWHLTKSPLFDALHKTYRPYTDLVPPSTVLF